MILLVPAGPASGSPAAATPEPRITVVFRFDDFSARSDTGLETRILQAFRSRGMGCTFGVIPRVAARSVTDPSPQEEAPLPPEKIRILREALLDHTVEVAQHGCSHQTARPWIGGRIVERLGRYHSEFFGVDREDQRRRIALGTKILEETFQVPISTFIPPWNGYDWNTLSVLEGLGFRNLSAARTGVVLLSSSLRFLPATCDAADLPRAVESARGLQDPAPVIVALFHQYDLLESGAKTAKLDFPGFEKILDWVSSQPDVRVLTVAGAAAAIPDLGARRFWWNRNAVLWRFTPPILGSHLPADGRSLYLTTPIVRSARILLLRVVLAACLPAALVGIAVFALREGKP
jgi:peptidoglycan/xylan/chitin deacetylase (PgdA/CDA1 family)